MCLLVDLTEEESASILADEEVLAFGVVEVVGSGVGSGVLEVSIATPIVVYPAISPLKVLEAVT